MSTAYIALGANLPFEGQSPQVTLARAITALAAAGFVPEKVSSMWRSPAWPPSDQADYYNAVVAIGMRGLSPQGLYAELLAIETRFGRERRERWAARTLDLDIIAIDDLVGVFDGIEVPHPRMQERAFVLAPLAEIGPDWRHPVLGRTATQLRTAGESQVTRIGPLGGG